MMPDSWNGLLKIQSFDRNLGGGLYKSCTRRGHPSSRWKVFGCQGVKLLRLPFLPLLFMSSATQRARAGMHGAGVDRKITEQTLAKLSTPDSGTTLGGGEERRRREEKEPGLSAIFRVKPWARRHFYFKQSHFTFPKHTVGWVFIPICQF